MGYRIATLNSTVKATDMRFITDRIRVFLFGIIIAILGLYSPSTALKTAHRTLDIYED